MIPYEDALAHIQQHASPLGKQGIAIEAALGAVVAESVISPSDIPNFDNSAVDGYGVTLCDVEPASNETPVTLKLAGTLPAGVAAKVAVSPGTAVKVLTGAPIPPGADAVVMQEFTEAENGHVRFFRHASPRDNIRAQGEEFRKGAVVLQPGTLITPPVLGLLGTLGITTVSVYRQPRIAIVITGNELVAPGNALRPGQIYESNSYSLAAALQAMGFTDVTCHHVGDDAAETHAIFTQVLEMADMVITTGGVSVGEFDLVKDVFTALGVTQHFWKVAIKPGKPVYFGTTAATHASPEKLVFGLPGNPVAVLLTFHLLVKPALLRMTGQPVPPPLKLSARLTRGLRKKPDRQEFVRGVLSSDEAGTLQVTPATGQGSHMLGGMAEANCLIDFPLSESSLVEGQTVTLMPLTWSRF